MPQHQQAFGGRATLAALLLDPAAPAIGRTFSPASGWQYAKVPQIEWNKLQPTDFGEVQLTFGAVP